MSLIAEEITAWIASHTSSLSDPWFEVAGAQEYATLYNQTEVQEKITDSNTAFAFKFDDPNRLTELFSPPKKGASLKRIMEWQASRSLLIDGLIRKPESTLLSLSHSGDSVSVLLAKRTRDLMGVGIDIELESRVIPHRVLEVLSAEAKKFKVSPIELWVMKESALKADPSWKGAFPTSYLAKKEGSHFILSSKSSKEGIRILSQSFRWKNLVLGAALALRQ